MIQQDNAAYVERGACRIVGIQFCQLPQRLPEAGIALEATIEVLDYFGDQDFGPYR